MAEKEGKRPKSKTKHKKIQIWNKYEVSESSIKRKGKFCPRCGNGVFLAIHKNRETCGKCGFSEIKIEKKQ